MGVVKLPIDNFSRVKINFPSPFSETTSKDERQNFFEVKSESFELFCE